MSLNRFKVGDRVRSTDFPSAVGEERGHVVGDVGTVVGLARYHPSTPRSVLVRFDRKQGIPQYDTQDRCHNDVWCCTETILEPTVNVTPEAIEEAVSGLDALLHGGRDKVLENGVLLLPGGAKAIIHVHQQKIKKGEPAVIVRRRGKSRHFTRVDINGPSTMIHSPIPDSCGARVWIETKAEVIGYE